MKKILLCIIILSFVSLSAQEEYNNCNIYTSDPSCVYGKYILPGVYDHDYSFKYSEKIYPFNLKYGRYEYPYFFYPFHFKKDLSPEYKHTSYKTSADDRFTYVSTITAYQPEFYMLKRYFMPTKFQYDLVTTKKLEYGGEGAYYEYIYQQINNGGGVEPNKNIVNWGERQGFIKPITKDGFNFYLAHNEDFRFLIAIPKDIGIDKFKKLTDVHILFLGTVFDTKQENDGISEYKGEKYKNANLPHYVIDYVILYDSRYCKYYIN